MTVLTFQAAKGNGRVNCNFQLSAAKLRIKFLLVRRPTKSLLRSQLRGESQNQNVAECDLGNMKPEVVFHTPPPSPEWKG